MTAEPRPPSSLGPDGKKLWTAVLEGYTPDAVELHVLQLACQARDDAAAARTAIKADGVTVEGLHGPRVHPAIGIARQAETNVSRLLGQLGVVDRPSRPARDEHTPGPKPLRRIG